MKTSEIWVDKAYSIVYIPYSLFTDILLFTLLYIYIRTTIRLHRLHLKPD